MMHVEVIAGLVLLLVGGEVLVRGSVAVASRMGLSPMLIGLILVGFGTSTPELMASVEGALRGAPGIAVGNVVGSNIANILLILGISALIFPMATNRQAFRRDGPVLMAATLLMAGVVLRGRLGAATGVGFLVLLAGYVAFSYVMDRRRGDAAGRMHAAEAAEVMPDHPHVGIGLALTVGGIGGVVLGADLLVGGAIEIARRLGLSESAIGLTLVAVGTSLPELVTSVMAALRRHADVAFGNVVGSNIFNILGIGGVTAMVTPIDIPPEIAGFDVWVMLAAAGLLLTFACTGWRLQRREGAVLLAAYGGYMAVQFVPSLRIALGIG